MLQAACRLTGDEVTRGLKGGAPTQTDTHTETYFSRVWCKMQMSVHAIPSTSHEFTVASWYAAAASASTVAREMVGEESGHRPVWGLARGGPPVVVKPKATGGHTLSVQVRTISGHTVVGLNDSPAVLLELVVKGATPAGIDTFLAAASAAYEAHFLLRGLAIYYTRKYYENVEWKFFGELPLRRINTVFMDAGMQDDILADVRRFLKDEKTYTRFGRPFKRVYCLHGPPGTGKTSIVTAIASELRRPLAIFNTDSLRDDTFIELLTTRPKDAVLMFEDVDALFRKRDVKADTGGMTFSTMLNALDGVLHPRGGIIFLTTNHLDRLDEAVNRPGRVDRLVEVGYVSASSAAAMWLATFPRDPLSPAILHTLVGKKMVPAQLSEVLFQNRDKSPAVVAELLIR